MPISTASEASFDCPHCGANLAITSSHTLIQCPGCYADLEARSFPAALRSRLVIAGAGEKASEGESVCFFHATRKAAHSCERCGRFICELCEMPVAGRQFCPKCLAATLQGEALPELVRSRLCWSRLSFLLGVWPAIFGIFIWPLLLITGGAAIFAALYGWNKPGSVVYGRRRWAAVCGLLGGFFQVALCVGLVILIWKSKWNV